MQPDIEHFLNSQLKWQKELRYLRELIVSCGFEEELKWKVPCFTYRYKNVVLIHSFKEYCAIAFFKGALLKDDHQLLIQQTEQVQSTRQLRFTSLLEIKKLEKIIKLYLFEAIEIEKAGLSVVLKKTKDYEVPLELTQTFKTDLRFKKAFEALTPGRQRGYLLHFASAKQSPTRLSRIEQCMPKILKGKGLTDCTCGLSKRLPQCDGSHKALVK